MATSKKAKTVKPAAKQPVTRKDGGVKVDASGHFAAQKAKPAKKK